MKTGLSSLGIAVASVLVLATVNPAHAEDTSTEVIDSLEAAVATQPGTPVTTAMPALSVDVDGSAGEVSAPAVDGKVLTVGLPGEDQAATTQGEMVLDVTAGTEFSTAVQDTGSGTFRALLHIDSSDAPTEYSFEVDGGELIPLEDGGVSVRDGDGNLIGFFEPAWAVDAAGVAVPTYYEVRGSTIVQHVQHTSATAFPVVADPFWIPALLVMARLTGHVATRAAQRGVSQALIKQVVQNGRKTAGNKGTSVFTQGSGKNKIRVVVDNKTGNIITVTKG